MTFNEAVNEKCLECKKPLGWNGFKGFEYAAECCGYVYRLEPKVLEYNLVIGRVKPEPPLFYHPV